jgi:uncharacterized LabA/DUF88 family protein
MKRLAILADVSNLYYCVDKEYKKKVDYRKYLEFLSDYGTPVYKLAYVAALGDEASGFIHALKSLGFECLVRHPKEYSLPGGGVKKKCDFDVHIAMDMVRLAPVIDCCILGSADGDLTPAVQYLSGKNIPTVIFACGISRELKASARAAIEIPPSVLQ